MNEDLIFDSELEEIYRSFRRVQSSTMGRGYRMPKDFSVWLKKMNEHNRSELYKITARFKTKWHLIDPERYFLCGFELLSSFSYKHFFDPRIIRLYINKDKNIKRQGEALKKNFIESVKFTKQYMKENQIQTFNVYCNSTYTNMHLPVIHYLSNKIDGFFLTWLLYSRMFQLSDDEQMMVPYIMEKYRENIVKLLNINDFLKKLKEKL